MNKKRLLIAEDHAILREGLRSLLAKVPDLEIVAEAPDGKEAIQYANQLKPDMVLMDLSMPHTNGTEAIRSIKLRHPGTKIIVLTGYGSIATALEAVRLGATHYLTKPADVDELIASFDRSETQADPAAPASVNEAPQTPSLARVEWEHIQRVLTDCGGNITKASERLGIHRRSLQRKLAKFPMPR